MFSQPFDIQVQGHSIRYYRSGMGPPLILIHGITTYSFIWRNIVERFTENYDVIAIDLLGCGESDKPAREDYSLKRQAFLVRDFCDALNLDRVHMICHDVGGGIGQIFAVNFEERLYDLCLVNSVAYNFWPVQPIIAMRTPIIRQIAMASLDHGMFELLVKRGLFHKEKLNEELMDLFVRPMKSVAGRKGFLHFAKCLDNRNLTDIEQSIRELSIPVLIVRSEADVYLTSSISEKLNSEISQSELVRIKTAGHFIQEDEPVQLSDCIYEFIQRSHDG